MSGSSTHVEKARSVLASVSRGCPDPQGRLPTCYSPVRRCTRTPKGTFSLDLHVLSTPPAFVLSQDQTLREIFEKRAEARIYHHSLPAEACSDPHAAQFSKTVAFLDAAGDSTTTSQGGQPGSSYFFPHCGFQIKNPPDRAAPFTLTSSVTLRRRIQIGAVAVG